MISPPTTVLAATLFHRLARIDALTRVILAQARLTALLTFRGVPEKRVLLDFASSPARTPIDPPERSADIFLTIDGDVMHEVLTGRLPPGEALGRRQMLLRGSAADLAKFIPMFDFGPLLYAEHLADVGVDGHARPTGYAPYKETLMSEQAFRGDPIPLVKLTPWETALFRVMNAVAYATGWLIGTLRHKVLHNLSLFDVLAAVSKGVEAATPKSEAKGPDANAQR